MYVGSRNVTTKSDAQLHKQTRNRRKVTTENPGLTITHWHFIRTKCEVKIHSKLNTHYSTREQIWRQNETMHPGSLTTGHPWRTPQHWSFRTCLQDTSPLHLDTPAGHVLACMQENFVLPTALVCQWSNVHCTAWVYSQCLPWWLSSLNSIATCLVCMTSQWATHTHTQPSQLFSIPWLESTVNRILFDSNTQH